MPLSPKSRTIVRLYLRDRVSDEIAKRGGAVLAWWVDSVESVFDFETNLIFTEFSFCCNLICIF